MTCLMLFLIFGSSTALIKVVKRALTGQTINCDGISEKVLYRQNIDISTTTNMSQKCSNKTFVANILMLKLNDKGERKCKLEL